MESEKICPIELILFQVQSYQMVIFTNIYTGVCTISSSTGPSQMKAHFRNDDPGACLASIYQCRWPYIYPSTHSGEYRRSKFKPNFQIICPTCGIEDCTV